MHIYLLDKMHRKECSNSVCVSVMRTVRTKYRSNMKNKADTRTMLPTSYVLHGTYKHTKC